MSKGLPIVDFSLYGLDKSQETLSDDDLKPLAESFFDALSQTGMVYLMNHGINAGDLKSINGNAEAFFNLPIDIKKKYSSPEDLGKLTYNGYVSPGMESTETLMDEGGGADILESMHIRPAYIKNWPDKDVPGLRPTASNFFNICGLLCHRILKLLCLALDYEDRDHILDFFRFGEELDVSDLKLVHYYPVPKELLAQKTRLAEHVDFSAITLVFQGEAGGLEYQAEDGSWLPVPPVKNCVLLNVGDVLQRWTSDKLQATRHRVVVPTNPSERSQSRYSMVFFAVPHSESPLRCLDGSDKYKPITISEYYEKAVLAITQYESQNS